MVMIKGDGAAPACILTPVCQTSTAGIRHLIPDGGTVITCNVNDLNDIAAGFAAHGQLDPFGKDCTFLVDAAPHRRHFPGNNHLGNVHDIFKQSVVPRLTGHFPQHLVFEILNLGIKFTHDSMYST